MEELEIGVRTPDGAERRYRFAEHPVLVGRAPDCDINICHEAVPRHLCRVWLEEDGRRVRVEERPGLTNALSLDGRPLVGGVTGERLRLEVGPIVLTAAAAAGAGGSALRRRRRGRALVLFAALAATAAAAIVLAAGGGRRPDAGQSLPASPFPTREPEAGGAATEDGPQRAALLLSRAEELLARRDAPMRARIRAVVDLERASALYAAAGDAPAAAGCAALASAHASGIEIAWRRDRLALSRSLAADDAAAAAAAAARLAGYLGAGDAAARAYLDRLAAGLGRGGTP